MLAAIRGIGGAVAVDGPGSVYVAGVQFGGAVSPIPVVQSQPVVFLSTSTPPASCGLGPMPLAYKPMVRTTRARTPPVQDRY